MAQAQFLILIGQNIRRIRSRKNITQFKLAALCDFEKASMSRIESGKTNTTVLTLFKISQALEVPISEFFYE